MIKKVTIKKVKVYDRPYSTDGSKPLYTYKKGTNIGKNFVMVTIQTNETGDDYYSTPAMPGERATTLKEGDSVLLSLTTSMSTDGQKEFKNFNYPTKDQLAEFAASIA